MPEKNQEEKKDIKRKKSRKIKKSTIKKISAVVVLLAILAVVLYFASRTLIPEKAAAIVNGEKITNQELEQKYSQLPDQYKLFITKEDFLDQIISVKLLLQEAEKKAVVVSDEEIEAELDAIKAQLPSEEEFDTLLKQRNMQLSQLKKQISEQLIINKLLNETVFSKVDVSESQIRGYYNNNEEDFKAKEGEIRVKHILVASEEEAGEILKDIKNGEDFSELAKSNSLDTGSAIMGGDLGFIQKGQMVKEFEDAAFGLKINEVSPIVQTQFGYHLIRRGADTISFDEAKEQIRQTLSNDLSNNAIELYISQLKSGAEIIKEGDKVAARVETFKETKDEICKKDGKVIIRLFSTAKNPNSQWISETFDKVAREYSNEVVAYHWQLDTGDNTLTEDVEEGIPKEEVDLFKKYNPKSTVPTFVFGCKYARIGNGYDILEDEKAEFKRLIGQLLTS